jgi:Fungal specific transcription factor domain
MKTLRRYYGKEELSEYAFLIEVYSYLASISNITFHSTSEERVITYDASIYSVDNWKETKTHGVIFGCASALFELIPQICQFGQQCFIEQTETGSEPSITFNAYQLFEAQIRSWKPPANFSEGHAIPDTLNAAYIYQESLLIYLHAGFYASNLTNAKFRHKVSASVSKILPLMESIPQVSSTVSLWSTFLWPFMIVGSCLVSTKDRQCLLQIYRQSPCTMAILDRAVQLLDLVWEQNSDSVFGPYG